MKRSALILVLVAGIAAAAVGIQSGASIAANNWFVNSTGAGHVIVGRSQRATYIASAGGLTTTAAYSMQLEAEVSRGFHIQQICVGTTAATAAALQTVTIRRTTTAGSGGTTLTAEGTGTVGVSQMVPGTGNWGGRSVHTGTAGTRGDGRWVNWERARRTLRRCRCTASDTEATGRRCPTSRAALPTESRFSSRRRARVASRRAASASPSSRSDTWNSHSQSSAASSPSPA